MPHECTCCYRCCETPCEGSLRGECYRSSCECGTIVIFDAAEWRAARETGLVTHVGLAGHVFVADKLGHAFQPLPGECDTHHEDGICDCVGVSFGEVDLQPGRVMLLREPVPGHNIQPGTYVLFSSNSVRRLLYSASIHVSRLADMPSPPSSNGNDPTVIDGRYPRDAWKTVPTV